MGAFLSTQQAPYVALCANQFYTRTCRCVYYITILCLLEKLALVWEQIGDCHHESGCGFLLYLYVEGNSFLTHWWSLKCTLQQVGERGLTPPPLPHPAVVPGFADDHFVGTAIEGDTVHLPCQLTNLHPNLRNLYVVRWRRDNDEIRYGNKYSKLLNNSLVIKDFNEEDTGKSFTCYISQIGSYTFQGEYPESGPRQLLMGGELLQLFPGGWGGILNQCVMYTSSWSQESPESIYMLCMCICPSVSGETWICYRSSDPDVCVLPFS